MHIYNIYYIYIYIYIYMYVRIYIGQSNVIFRRFDVTNTKVFLYNFKERKSHGKLKK